MNTIKKFTLEVLHRMIFAILFVVIALIFNIVMLLIQFYQHSSYWNIAAQFLITLVFPILLFFVFLYRQYFKMCILAYNACSTMLRKALIDYFNTDSFKNLKDKTKIDVSFETVLSKIENNPLKEKMSFILKKIPFSKIYNQYTVKSEDLENNKFPELFVKFFFSKVDEFVYKKFAVGKLNYVIYSLIALNITIAFSLL